LAPVKEIAVLFIILILTIAVIIQEKSEAFRSQAYVPSIGTEKMPEASPPKAVRRYFSSPVTQWRSLAMRVRNQSGMNDEELKLAYRDAEALILKNEAASLAAMRKDLPRLIKEGTLRESFFIVSAFTRTLSNPTQVLLSLWAIPPAAEENSDPHHNLLTSVEMQRRMEAYATKELRRRLASGFNLSSEESMAVIARLSERASLEKSIDISLEQFQLLHQLNAEVEIQAALMKRSGADRTLIQGFLSHIKQKRSSS
jgi:hypothetical protein